jgi:HK97 gp10 family phage protein
MDGNELRRLSADIGRAAAQAEPRARLVVAKTARDIEGDAKALAPVDTGNLKASITSDVRGLEATIGPTAAYGVFLELGTSRMAAQPYMGPAADRRQGPFAQAMESLGEDLLGG